MYKTPKKPPPTKPKPFSSSRRPLSAVDVNGQAKENAKDAVEVFCRIRPLRSMTELLCVKKCSDTLLQLVSPSGSKSSCYNFKHIFDENVGQEAVFTTVCLPLVKDLLDAKNGLLFTYGITSSGKTHTITGSPQNCGILPRSLDALFNSIRDNRAQKYIFKPDGQNGFDIQTAPDAILQWQTERNAPKPPATPLISGRSARQRRQDANDLKEWTQRAKDATVVPLTHKHNAFAIFVSSYSSAEGLRQMIMLTCPSPSK